MPAKEEATMPAKEEGTIPDREENTMPGKEEEEESKPATGSTSEEEQERAGEAEVKDPSSSNEEKV